MDTSRDLRIAAWAGIVSFPFAVIAIPVTGSVLKWFPNWSESPAQIAHWFADNRARTLFQAFGSNFAFIMMTILVAGIVGFLCRQNLSGLWTRTLLPVSVVLAAALMVANAFWGIGALAGTSHHSFSDFEVKLMFVSAVAVWLNVQPLCGLLLLATGAAIRHCELLPRWLRLSAIIIAIPNILVTFTMLIGEGWLAPVEIITVLPYGLFFCWITAAAVILLQVSKRATVSESAIRVNTQA